ncbi:MAG TPA: adenylate/guanylate cyclase domain-containing protein [Candidatus Dormibacteraeota bacterium]|nr:adenylate/guanylate cyclase domain-containing protein [Candidatus Dormibacteraeota bacterium]
MTEERKVVSILFVDLVDFTARSDRTDPEDVRDLLHSYHALVREQAERFGGTVEKFIGDAVMAVFGAPIAHTDDPERAVRAGLRAVEAVKRLDLTARAAVNTGEAVIALGPGHAAGEALAMGDVVNTASRMQQAAPPGRVVVGEETHRATRKSIRYEPLGGVDAKGKQEQLEIWAAVEPTTEAERRARISPLVGRDRQLALLGSVWDAAAAQRRLHTVTVVGPAGIGKSRLVRELGAIVEQSGGRVIRGRSLAYDTRDVYGAFAEQLRTAAGVVEQDAPPDARSKVAALVGSLMAETEAQEVVRSLSLILGLGIDSPIELKPLLLFGARRFVEQLGLEQATMLVFEDAHWADAAQLELITYLAMHVKDAPVVLLATARPELLDRNPTWGSGLGAHTMITLDPVSADDSANLVRHLAGEAMPSESLERLIEVAGGNPLFLEELVAGFRDGAGADVELPTSVRAAIAARVDALPAPQRDALLAASVIGRVFWRGAVLSLRKIDGIDEVLDALEARDFLRREPTSRVRDDVEFVFKHVLIRDVCYATLTRAERRNAHEAVARYIEQVSGDKVRELAWLLAHHWEHAGEAAKAIEYLLLAAQRAQEALAVDETLELLARAESLSQDEETRTRTHLTTALTLVKFEMYDRASVELEGLLPKLEGRERIEAMVGLARSYHWTERTADTIAISEKAIALAEETGAVELVAPAMARLGQGHAMRGDAGDLDAALELGERAIQTWTPGALPQDLADHTHLMAHMHYWTGTYERALSLSRAVRELAVDPNSVEALLRGRGVEGLALASMGRYEQALESFDWAIALGRELGRPVRILLNYSTTALRDIHDFAEAKQRSEESLSGAPRDTTFHMPYMNAEVDLLHTDLLAGDVGAAEVRWNENWADIIGTPAWERWFLGSKMAAFRAEIALESAQFEDAAQWAARAIEMTRTARRPKYEAVARVTLGRALHALGRREDGLAELEAAVASADRLGDPAFRWRARTALAQLLAARGEEARANDRHIEAAGIIRDIESSLAPERARRFIASPRVTEALTFAAGR